MATDELRPAEARALRVIEAIHGGPEDVDDDPPIDPVSIRRMQSAIDRAFAQADAARERATRRGGFLELAGDALRTRIAALRAQLGGQLQLAHRNLGEMSDDDLRTLLVDLEEYAAHQEGVP